MEKILTIVIPTYNMQDYLRRCLDSLIVPEEQMKQLEVLVINDGSKDNSSAIAHEYQDKYPDTFRVIDKENGNYGSCVNRGLKEAMGKYIKILDADDWFNTEVLNIFMQKLIDTDVDVALTNFDCYYPDGTEKVILNIKQKDKIISLTDAMNESLPQMVGIQMHAICYKRKIFTGLNYHQTEGISYTDQEWILIPWAKVEDLLFLPISLYQYDLGRDGQTMDPKVFEKRIDDQFVGVMNSIMMIEAVLSQIDELHKKLLSLKMLSRMESIYKFYLTRRYAKEQCSKLIEFDEKLKKSFPFYYTKLNQVKMSKYYSCHYIQKWRKGGYVPLNSGLFLCNDAIVNIVSGIKKLVGYK